MNPVLAHLEKETENMVNLLRTMVEKETPSTDKPALDGFAEWAKELFRGIGAKAEILPQPTLGNNVRVEWGSGKRQVLIVGHFDTVWSIGEIKNRPFKVEGGRMYGPGVYDMKGGIVATYFALKALGEMGKTTDKKVVVILNGDEEIGSVGSRVAIIEEAKKSEYAMILEPGLAKTGAIKTARKGGAGFEVWVEGKASHAGSAIDEGINAILEMSHQVIKISAMADAAAGTSVNVGVITGGTRSNVVPAEAYVKVDVRVATLVEAERIKREAAALTPVLPGAKIRVKFGSARPPMERTPAIVAAYQKTRALAQELGFDLAEGSTGGGSDGNFTASVGTPTIDGLGMMGDGAHAVTEFAEVAWMPKRAALLARLIETL